MATNLGGTAIKPKGWDRTGMESFKYFLYDPDTGAILSRTPESWMKIVGFYLVYYALLATFWIGCLNIFFLTIPEHQPRWMLDASIIGANPGVGIRPKTSDLKIDSSMYLLNGRDGDMTPSNKEGEGERNADYARRMELFMKGYKNVSRLHECADNNDRNKGKCIFDPVVLGECADFPYGYTPVDGALNPCLFLKLNKIYNFNPAPVNVDDLDEPEFDTMTAKLKDQLRTEGAGDNIYIDCWGRNGGDREGMTLEYFPPNQAISLKYFPYTGGNYQSPLVAIKVTPNPSVRGQLLHIECRAWYSGVKHDSKDKAGLTQFEVLVR